MRTMLIFLAFWLVAACTTKFKETDGSDADTESEGAPDGEDADVSPDEGEPDSEDLMPEVACTTDEECRIVSPGYICCDGMCVDPALDSNHCGRCDNPCTGEMTSCCSGECRDLLQDIDHCGECDHPCLDMEACCEGSCTDVKSNVMHCGDCDTVCDIGQPCDDGDCLLCAPSNVLWPGGEICYLEGIDGLGRYSYRGALAAVFDTRLEGGVPREGTPMSCPPLFGVITVDNIHNGDPSTMRDYNVQVRKWDPHGNESFMKEYDAGGSGLLALDGLHLPRPDMPGALLVTLGGMMRNPADVNDDILNMDTLDVVPDSPTVETFSVNVGSFNVLEHPWYWRLFPMNEGLYSLTGFGDGAVIGVGSLGSACQQPAAALKRPPMASDDTMLLWSDATERYAFATRVTRGSDRQLYILVSDDANDTYDMINIDYDLRLYCYLASGIDTAAPVPALTTPCWSAPYIDMASEDGISELGLGLAAGRDDSVYVLYENGPNGYIVTHIDGNGSTQDAVPLSMDPGMRLRVTAMLVDTGLTTATDWFVYVVGYQFDNDPTNNYHKTPTVWKFSESLSPITDFGTHAGREEYGEGFFTDAILLRDGSILTKIYEDDWGHAAEDHTTDRVCLRRVNSATGEFL